MPAKFYRPSQVARMLGLSVQTIRAKIHSGDLPAERLGRLGWWMIRSDHVDELRDALGIENTRTRAKTR